MKHMFWRLCNFVIGLDFGNYCELEDLNGDGGDDDDGDGNGNGDWDGDCDVHDFEV